MIALYAAGRFAMFFWRSDSQMLALSLSSAQWTSLVLLGLARTGLLAARARRRAAQGRGPASGS